MRVRRYELVFATSQMRCRPVSVHQHVGKPIVSAQSSEAMDLADDVIAKMGGSSESVVAARADDSEISELRRQLKEVQQQRDMALQALGKSKQQRLLRWRMGIASACFDDINRT